MDSELLEDLKAAVGFQVATGPGCVEMHLLFQRVASAFMGCRPCQGEAGDRMLLEIMAASAEMEDSQANLRGFLMVNASRVGARRYSITSLLRFFTLSGFLHADVDLREALESCCTLVLPQNHAGAALSLL